MVKSGRTFDLPHLFLGNIEKAANQYFVHMLSLVELIIIFVGMLADSICGWGHSFHLKTLP